MIVVVVVVEVAHTEGHTGAGTPVPVEDTLVEGSLVVDILVVEGHQQEVVDCSNSSSDEKLLARESFCERRISLFLGRKIMGYIEEEDICSFYRVKSKEGILA